MKKMLLSAVLPLAALSAQAQSPVLYESFSGENCISCAAVNPTLQALIANNPNKAILLSYQTAFPTAGPLHSQNTADVNARVSYYGITSAPFGLANGKVIGSGPGAGNPALFNQTELDIAAGLPSLFTISATHSWSSDGDSLYATVNLAATANSTTPGGIMRVRAALVEQLDFSIAPGSNGETEFRNVVRRMYPDAAGTAVPATWTTGQTQTINLGGPVPNHVDKSAGVFLVVWLQNDNDKSVVQAGKSTPLSLVLDAGSGGAAFPSGLACATGTVPLAGNVTLRNPGTTTLTSATIFYRYDNSALQQYNWSGTLVAGGSANVVLPSFNAAPGVHTLYDSVALPNGVPDMNLGNSASTARTIVHNSNPNNLPMNTNFDAPTMPNNWVLYDADNNGRNWVLFGTVNHTAGGARSLKFDNLNFVPGETGYLLLPKPSLAAGAKALDFWTAYAQYEGTEQDKLEVVYSTDCGTSWTVLWRRSGADLATAAPVDNGMVFTPTASQWAQHSVDMSALTHPGTIVAFRATSDYGNNLYLDDVVFRSGPALTVTGISAAPGGIVVFPNPARGTSRLSFELPAAADVDAAVLDATGRTVLQLANGRMEAGARQFSVPTETLAPGLYTVRVITGSGTLVQCLSVVK